jgi:hypothetical protein
MKELLSGIRVIKYFNWQNFFTDRINEKRREELKHLAGTVRGGWEGFKLLCFHFNGKLS